MKFLLFVFFAETEFLEATDFIKRRATQFFLFLFFFCIDNVVWIYIIVQTASDVRFLKIFYSETTGKFTLAMYFYLGQE